MSSFCSHIPPQQLCAVLNEMKAENVHCAHTLSTWNKQDFYTSLRGPECATHDTFHKCYFVSLRVL